MAEQLQERLNRFTETVSKSLTERAKKQPGGCREYKPHVTPEQTTCPECKESWESELKGWHVCPKCVSKQCLRRFKGFCPTEYARTDETRLPREQWAKIKDWSPGGRSLLFVGPSRTCKTRSAWMLIKRLSNKGLKVTPFSPIGFGTQLVDAQMKGEGMQFLERVSKAELVFFDDLGKAKLTDNVEACLFEVIEQRTAWCRPTIATTNDTSETLKGRMTENRGEPFVRRLREFFDVIEFPEQGNQ